MLKKVRKQDRMKCIWNSTTAPYVNCISFVAQVICIATTFSNALLIFPKWGLYVSVEQRAVCSFCLYEQLNYDENVKRH